MKGYCKDCGHLLIDEPEIESGLCFMCNGEIKRDYQVNKVKITDWKVGQ